MYSLQIIQLSREVHRTCQIGIKKIIMARDTNHSSNSLRPYLTSRSVILMLDHQEILGHKVAKACRPHQQISIMVDKRISIINQILCKMWKCNNSLNSINNRMLIKIFKNKSKINLKASNLDRFNPIREQDIVKANNNRIKMLETIHHPL